VQTVCLHTPTLLALHARTSGMSSHSQRCKADQVAAPQHRSRPPCAVWYRCTTTARTIGFLRLITVLALESMCCRSYATRQPGTFCHSPYAHDPYEQLSTVTVASCAHTPEQLVQLLPNNNATLYTLLVAVCAYTHTSSRVLSLWCHACTHRSSLCRCSSATT